MEMKGPSEQGGKVSKQEIFSKSGTRWVKESCVVITVLAVLSGCAGVHLYDQEKNETATAIKTKKTKVDIEKVFVAFSGIGDHPVFDPVERITRFPRQIAQQFQ